MRPAVLRARLFTVAAVALIALAWVYLAPTQIGGSTEYVITGGISMEPRFHTGDLAVVRPAAQYRVGDIVAYHSTLLHVVVLHRIIGRAGNRYIFKGDNNNFIDPTQPVRSQLVGKLWWHIPHGGAVLRWLHAPQNAALICAIFGLFLLLGTGETQRRRRRRRQDAPTRFAPMTFTENRLRSPSGLMAAYAASGVVVLVFLALGVVAFSRPRTKPSVARVPYTEQVRFGYAASAPAGPVYPTGSVKTGDPIFLSLVHRLRFTAAYHLSTHAPHDLQGSVRMMLTLAAPTGWSRTLALGPAQYFRGPAVRTQALVDLGAVQTLINRVAQMTGQTTGTGYTLAVVPQVHIRGVLASRALDTRFAPMLSFQISSSQLQPAASTGQSGAHANLDPSQAGSVAAATMAANSIGVVGQHVSVLALRLAAVLGLLLAGVVFVLAAVAKRLTPFDEAARIRAQYGHLIVPAIVGPEGLGAPLVDVPTIADLARLAEAGQRMILHSRDGGGDTYLLRDEGAVYRYTADPGNVVWGEWSETGPRPLSHVGGARTRPTVVPRPATVTAATASAAASVVEGAPAVWPRPAFLEHAKADAPTEVRAPAPVTPAAPRAAQPAPARSTVARPRLRRWLDAQGQRAVAVRQIGSAILGTDQR